MKNLLSSLRAVFSQSKSGLLKKQHTPFCHKDGYVSPVKRGLMVYIVGAL